MIVGRLSKAPKLKGFQILTNRVFIFYFFIVIVLIKWPIYKIFFYFNYFIGLILINEKQLFSHQIKKFEKMRTKLCQLTVYLKRMYIP